MELVHPKPEPRKRNWYVIGLVILTVLIAGGCVLGMLYLQDQNDKRVAKLIMDGKGTADFRYLGPKWLVENVRPYLPGTVRVCNVHLIEPEISDGLLTEIGALRQVDRLDLTGTSITDDGLKKLDQLKGVKQLIIRSTKITDAGLVAVKDMPLVELDAADTQITDAGLESLVNQANLKSVRLTKTKTTAEGRAKLRKALPGCEVTPEP